MMATGLFDGFDAAQIGAIQAQLAANRADAYHLVIESSANVNTNPRIEQSTIHRSTDLYAFYAELFDGIRSIDRRA